MRRRLLALAILLGAVLVMLFSASDIAHLPSSFEIPPEAPPQDPLSQPGAHGEIGPPVPQVSLGRTGPPGPASSRSESPFFVVSDSDGSGTVDGADVQSAIDACGTGHLSITPGGCTIVLPRGEIRLAETITIGTHAGTDDVTGLTLKGHGVPYVMDNVGGHSNGTLFVWRGKPHGTMLRINAALSLTLEDIGFRMSVDPNGSTGQAKIGIEFAPENSSSSTIQGTTFRNISIVSSGVNTPAGSRGIYFKTPGSGDSGQADRGIFEHLTINGTEVGVECDESQSVFNEVRNSYVDGLVNAFRVSQGNVDVRDSIVACWRPSCVVYWLQKPVNMSPFRTMIERNHWETGSTVGTFLKIGNGYSPTGVNEGPIHPVVVRDNNIQAQCANCVVKFVDASIGADLIIEGNSLRASAGQSFSVEISNFAINRLYTYVYWRGNFLSKYPGGISLVNLHPLIAFQNLRKHQKSAVVYNDLNLNSVLDPGEAPNLAEGATAPATCSINQLYLDTDERDDTGCATVADAAVCRCNPENTWTTTE